MGIVGINHNAAAAAYAVPAATVHQWLTTKTGPATKTAFLTFDDGPSVLTPQVLDALKLLGVPATFFVIGRYLELNPTITQRAMAEGHAICLHSYSHDYTYLFPGRVGNVVNIAADYDKALAVATRVLGPTYAPGGYRYPGGHMSWTGLEAADAARSAERQLDRLELHERRRRQEAAGEPGRGDSESDQHVHRLRKPERCRPAQPRQPRGSGDAGFPTPLRPVLPRPRLCVRGHRLTSPHLASPQAIPAW